MRTFQEPIRYQDARLRLKVWTFAYTGVGDAGATIWHYHKEVEFILVLDGELAVFTPNNRYPLQSGDVVVIGSNQLHRSRTPQGQEVRYVVLHVDLSTYFDPAMMHYSRHFMEVLHPLEALNYIFRESACARSEAGEVLLRIHDEVIGQPKGYEIAVSMSIKQLLLTLLRHDDRELLQPHEGIEAGLLGKIAEYVDSHLGSRIDMGSVSELAGMSYVYFSKYFKRKTGLAFTDYVNRKRIARAEQLLIVEGLSANAAAIAVGIENMSHFYALFKRFSGCTPKQFQSRIGRVGKRT
ncbi:helix-turn-helix domain-containing protein [Paenibacillus xanthanilyticus]|uniref:Helix-turn-helix domain-containing protein n=1 Tax=Paenibacillus xanthanilyticus TaxID=1783531 RepID=A0ABV8K7H8_9BACL